MKLILFVLYSFVVLFLVNANFFAQTTKANNYFSNVLLL